MSRFALRIDANQNTVVEALKVAGYSVQVIGQPVDLLVGYITAGGDAAWAMLEVKDGQKVKSAQKLTTAQEKFFLRWAGWPLFVVDSAETALACMEALTCKR
jgi:hypothetical protein